MLASGVLREFKQVRQEGTVGTRRWFESDGFDLILWFDAKGALEGFQVCYDFGSGEHALTWRPGAGCAHHAVDGGADALRKLTPILVPDGAVPWPQLLRTFEDRATSLDPEWRTFVRARLAESATKRSSPR